MNNTKSYLRGSILGKLLLPVIIAIAFLALVFLGVIPSIREIDNTRATIVQLDADLKQQRALLPIHLQLQKHKEELLLPEGIQVSKLQRLKIDDLAMLPEVFETLARECKVELVSATPQVRSLKDVREMLRVDARMRGEFLTFNNLLNRLNEMPYVESIESLAIDVTNLGQEMSISVWLAIQ
jgi:hypothetical protein